MVLVVFAVFLFFSHNNISSNRPDPLGGIHLVRPISLLVEACFICCVFVPSLQVIFYFQMASILSRISLPWPSPFDLLTIGELNLQTIESDCIFPHMSSFYSQSLLVFCTPIVCAVLFILVALLHKRFPRMCCSPGSVFLFFFRARKFRKTQSRCFQFEDLKNDFE